MFKSKTVVLPVDFEHSAHPVCVLILYARDASSCGKKNTTDISYQLVKLYSYVIRRVDKVIPCYCTGYDGHIHPKKQKRQTRKAKDKNKQRTKRKKRNKKKQGTQHPEKIYREHRKSGQVRQHGWSHWTAPLLLLFVSHFFKRTYSSIHYSLLVPVLIHDCFMCRSVNYKAVHGLNN